MGRGAVGACVMITSILITFGIIAVCLAVTFVLGAVGLIAAIIGGLLLTCYIDPKGLAR